MAAKFQSQGRPKVEKSALARFVPILEPQETATDADYLTLAV